MCTNLAIPSQNYHVSARCMDLATEMNTVVTAVARNTSFPSNQPAQNPLTWSNQYGFVGVNVENTSYYSDGMNEQGLSVGLLWLAGSTYPASSSTVKNIYTLDVPGWALGNFATVEEVRNGLNTINVIDLTGAEAGKFVVHYIFQDATGAAITVEFMNGEMQVYDNANGVMTNAPTYPWQLLNMSNYVNNSVFNNPALFLGQEINGSGFLSVPGDATPPSRFVHTTLLCQTLYEPQSAQEAVNQALQILQNNIVPYGTIMTGTTSQPVLGDRTQWGVVRDHANLVYYYFSAFNNVLKAIDLTQLSFTTTINNSIDAGNWYTDVTSQFNPQSATM